MHLINGQPPPPPTPIARLCWIHPCVRISMEQAERQRDGDGCYYNGIQNIVEKR